MMKNSKYNLVPYEVIERAITGETAALLTVQERHKAYIVILSILVYTFFTRMFDFMLPLVVKYSIVAA